MGSFENKIPCHTHKSIDQASLSLLKCFQTNLSDGLKREKGQSMSLQFKTRGECDGWKQRVHDGRIIQEMCGTGTNYNVRWRDMGLSRQTVYPA